MAGDVKSKVLHAAARLFLSKGYQASTVRGIAKEAGVNLGSLTFAFGNKEQILCGVQRGCDRSLVYPKKFSACKACVLLGLTRSV